MRSVSPSQAAAMADQDDGAIGQHRLEGFADLTGAGRVQMRGGLVHEQQRCVPQECAGQGDLLPLAC